MDSPHFSARPAACLMFFVSNPRPCQWGVVVHLKRKLSPLISISRIPPPDPGCWCWYTAPETRSVVLRVQNPGLLGTDPGDIQGLETAFSSTFNSWNASLRLNTDRSAVKPRSRGLWNLNFFQETGSPRPRCTDAGYSTPGSPGSIPKMLAYLTPAGRTLQARIFLPDLRLSPGACW